jgi:hypothetical protein
MWKTVGVVAIMWWIAQTAGAKEPPLPPDELQIVGQDMQWPTGAFSLDFTLSLKSLSDQPPVDLLQGWQMKCKIIPVADAFGVGFTYPTSCPDTFNKADESIFTEETGAPDMTGLIIGSFFAPNTMEPTSVTAPTEFTKFLTLHLSAADGAHGQFNIAVVPDSCADAYHDTGYPPSNYVGAAWYYAPDFSAARFHGMPFENSSQEPVPIIVGSVTIVPEPSSCFLIFAGGVVLLIRWLRRRSWGQALMSADSLRR